MPVRPERTLSEGDIGEKYEMGDRIGVGAFSKVYLGTAKATGQPVAIKVPFSLLCLLCFLFGALLLCENVSGELLTLVLSVYTLVCVYACVCAMIDR